MRALARTCVAVAGAALLVTAVAGAVSFQDPAGDQIDAASFPGPDITTVDVTNDPAGLITFRVAVPNYPTLPPNSAIALVLDLDKNLETGDEGVEAEIFYVVGDAGMTGVLFDRRDGLELVGVDPEVLSASYAAGTFTLTAPRSELRDTNGFAFAVIAVRVTLTTPQEVGGDFAPNGDELYTYDVTGLAPPKPPTLTIGAINGIPPLPSPGKRFVATAFVTRSDTEQLVDRASVSCRARIGTKTVKATGRHRAFNAQCTVLVPRNAKGRVLRGTMTVRAAGATTSKAFKFKVK